MTEDEMTSHLKDRIRTFRGDITELERAIGAYCIGRVCGWRALYVMHDLASIARFERLLGFELREPHLPATSVYPPGSVPWMAELGVEGFWKAIMGESRRGRTDRRGR